YEEEAHVTDMNRRRHSAFALQTPANPAENPFGPPKPRGSADQALAAAKVRHRAEYYIPIEHHNPMELYASTVIYEADGKLMVYDKTQGVQNVQRYVCGVFGLNPDNVRVLSPFVGGAFGSGLRPQYEVVLAVQGALQLQRSTQLVLTRAQMYGLGYRPATIERVALGASTDGTLQAITHEAIAMTSQYEDFSRNDTSWSALLYKSANAKYVHKLARLDVPTPCDMRAPGAATGVYALECAMDELAVALKLDPVELRLRCYSESDQNNDVPFTSKQLKACYRKGAEAFGWARRIPEPRSMRDGNDLVGWGMATGIWEALQVPTAARIVLTGNGHAEVSCATTDIGTGTYTIMAQVTADMLGVPLENVTVKLGDSSLPYSQVEGGSWMAASVAHAIAAAADKVRLELLGLAQKMPGSPLAGLQPDDVVLSDGMIVAKQNKSRAVSRADAMRHGGVDRVEHEKLAEFKEDSKHARNTHSAIFAEVKVDEQLGIIRVTRVVNAVA
ncbi:MAG TPA: molybdopterin cofactor-binding domain-containing protein, partial [Xanthobacteraceae bacterium]